jgi:hypothetical protein
VPEEIDDEGLRMRSSGGGLVTKRKVARHIYRTLQEILAAHSTPLHSSQHHRTTMSRDHQVEQDSMNQYVHSMLGDSSIHPR